MKEQRYILGVYKLPGMSPFLLTVRASLNDMQALVGGHIEIVPSGKDGIDIVIHGEGKFLYPVNIPYSTEDYLCGPVFFVGADGKGGSASLTKSQVEWVYNNINKLYIEDSAA